jgi:sugar phosphate isomerase/epimerase
LGRIPFRAKIDAAAAAGFAGLSAYFRECEQPRPIRQAISDAGLFLAELDGPMNWLADAGPAAPSPAAVVERAWQLGARSITVIETSGMKPPLEVAVDAFASVCDLAQQADVLVHIEPFPWSGIDDLGFAADIIAGAGRANGGVLLDTWHLFRGPDRGTLPSRLDPSSILSLQINDVQPTPHVDPAYEAMHERLLPGAGAAAAAIRTLLADLRAGGCIAPVGVEVFSDELVGISPAEIARRALEALRRVTPGDVPDENSRPTSSDW